MRLPDNGRLFVGGIAAGTGAEDLRRHFCRYGEVADTCLPRDRLTGGPRSFGFVQFRSPCDAGRALADPHHVINGRQVYVARAKPRQFARSIQHKPLSDRIICVNKLCYRVGDKLRISFGPLGDTYEQCELVNKIKKFGSMVGQILIFDCTIGYISKDGEECLIRWPPGQSDGESGYSGQGTIRQSCGSIEEFAELSSSGNSSEAGQSQTWCWLVV